MTSAGECSQRKDGVRAEVVANTPEGRKCTQASVQEEAVELELELEEEEAAAAAAVEGKQGVEDHSRNVHASAALEVQVAVEEQEGVEMCQGVRRSHGSQSEGMDRAVAV
jgi:hypothetical protein